MSYCKEWDATYQAKRHVSRWPWSDLVSLVMRYGHPDNGFRRVLELGCGVGANISLFADLGADYHSVEGSPTAVAFVHERFPELREKVVVGDYTRRIPFGGQFDLIVDRSSLTCNSTASIASGTDLLKPLLRDAGRFIAVDWFSVDHFEFGLGREAADEYTRKGFATGGFAGTGNVHFFDRQHLLSFFDGYRVLNLQHRIVVEESGDDAPRRMATWNMVAQRDMRSQE